MIKYVKHTLSNGLTVIFHRDKTSPIAAVNLLYKVGARNENENKTGFAHLFEHLMFEGSLNIKNFDKHIHEAGGYNNAYTTNDYTLYYDVLPKINIETAMWLEADRMRGLDLTAEKIDVQKNVVIEEYKQRYLNRPYGDLWLILRPLAYKVHPYKWPTIGKDISHIQNATEQDVKQFFQDFYKPNNAILSVVADMTEDKALKLVEKWFGDIKSSDVKPVDWPQEPQQTEKRFMKVERDVPADMLILAFHTDKVNSHDYYSAELLSDIMTRGESGYLYRKFVKDLGIFTSFDTYQTSSLDPGLFIISAKLSEDTNIEQAENMIWQEIDELKNHYVSQYDMEKIIHKYETSFVFGEISVSGKASNLSVFEMIDDAELINSVLNKVALITKEDIMTFVKKYLNPENSNVLYYTRKK